MGSTGNALGSSDSRDFHFNASKLDQAMNDLNKDIWRDRFGVDRLTWSGMQKKIEQTREELATGALAFVDQRFVLRDFHSFTDYSPANNGTDVTAKLQKAVDDTPDGGTLLITGGPYTFDKVTVSKPLTLTGDAKLIHNGFRIKTSKFRSELVGPQVSRAYSTSSRAFQVIAYEDQKDYEDVKILFNRFEGFFYATDFRGIAYAAEATDPANRVLRNTLIMGCTSIGPDGKNAGHFQHTGVTNSKCIGCTAEGGKNATSYNFINGNGFIIVQGCYDKNNEYGSLEIENNQVSWALVDGCAFEKHLWIDDTSNVSITGCVVKDRILITAEHYDTDNIQITGGVAQKISITKFGATGGIKRHKSVSVNGITLTGNDDPGGHDIFADEFCDRLIVQNATLNGNQGGAIGIIRHPLANHLIRNNNTRIERNLTISGSGGKVIEYGNDNMVMVGNSDSRHLSNLLRNNKDYVDLPGKYAFTSKYTGAIPPTEMRAISLPVPNAGDLGFRGISLWVMIRDSTSNNTSSFRVDGMWRVVGNTIALNFSSKYGTYGIDFDSIVPSMTSPAKDSINIAFENTSATKTLQVTIVPEVTSRLGVEE